VAAPQEEEKGRSRSCRRSSISLVLLLVVSKDV